MMFFSCRRSPSRQALLSRLTLGCLLTLSALWVTQTGVAQAAETAEKEPRSTTTVPLGPWLVAGPQDALLPLGHGDTFGLDELLKEVASSSQVAPAAGRRLGGLDWQPVKLTKDNGVALEPSDDRAQVAWLAGYLQVNRFTVATLKITGRQRLRVFLDGKPVADLTGDPTDEPRTAEAEIQLGTGSHQVLVKTLATPGAKSWTVSGELMTSVPGGAVRFVTDPQRGLTQDDLLDVARYSGLRLSPDGRFLLTAVGTPSVPADHSRRWLEILDTESGEPVRRLDDASGFRWLPGASDAAYVIQRKGKEGTDLIRANMSDGKTRLLAEGLEDLSSAIPLPDGSGLLLEFTQSEDKDSREVKRYRALPDRWPGWRDRSYWVSMDWNGARRRLTVAMHGASFDDLRPDGGALLLRKVDHLVTERPFSRTTLVEVDLNTLEERELGQYGWLDDVSYSPDGRQVLLTGSPALFGDLGRNIGEHPIANDYDTQAYLLDVADPDAPRALTRDLDAAVQSAHWSAYDGLIYFEVQDKTWSRVLRLDPSGSAFEALQPATDTLGSFTLADDAGVMAYVGSSPNRPYAVFVQPTEPGAAARSLAEPSAQRLSDVTFGEVKPWVFTSEDGGEILGRVYYPAGFDPSKKYPLIVFYYGGTVPINRSFGGRYPKELWAANGYVVYVPQPSGATGFGQELSARHVNAWGRRTADEIIEGTKKFVAEHEFIDGDRVGCTGASYGGFMTMYLQTRTDIFAAAISHAGISNLASYWGQGWWGYLYSAVASAESYPWNNPELYVGQSPIYAADKIQTPLLLLHGDADTNVPPVESHQMYTALKVLGKPVELIEIAGENHTIVSYEKRKLWSKTILAWFDRWLKDQPEAWEELWGDDQKPKG